MIIEGIFSLHLFWPIITWHFRIGAFYQIASAKVAAALASLASSEVGEVKSSLRLEHKWKTNWASFCQRLKKTTKKTKADSLHTEERGGWLVLSD